MKKVFALTAIVLFSGNSIIAQSDNSVRLGIKIAPNLAWSRADTKGLESDGSLLGYSAGLMSEFPFGSNGNYRFATGLMVNNIGAKLIQNYSAGDSSVVSTSKTKLRYVELPITIKLMTNEIGYMRYFGQLGLDAGINVRAKGDGERILTRAGSTTSVKVTDQDVKDYVNGLKLGLVIGAGMEYNFSGGTSALIGVGYHSSFTKLYKKDFFEGDENMKTFADYVELTLGVFF